MRSYNINEAVTKKSRKKELQGKTIEVPKNIEAEYYKMLRFMLEQIKERAINNILSGLDVQQVKEVIHDESVSARINRLIREFKQSIDKQFSTERLNKFSQRMVNKTDDYHKYRFTNSIDYGFGIDIKDIPEFKAYRQFINMSVRKNMMLIKSLKGDNITKLETALRTAIEQGKSIEQIKKVILNNYDVSKKKAVMIARNEIKNITSMLNIKRLNNLGFTVVKWVSAHDERVRGNPSGRYPDAKPSHYIMNGLYCRPDDPTVYSRDGYKWLKRTSNMPQEHAGEAINCYHKDTEVFTDRGFLLIKDIKINDKILTLNPITQDLEWSYCKAVMSKFANEIVNIKSKIFNVSTDVNHRFFVYTEDERKKTLKSQFRNGINNLSKRTDNFFMSSKWVGKDIKEIKINNLKIPIKDYCILMGYYLSEGNVDNRKDRNGIKISQTKYLKKMFNDLKFFNPRLGKDAVWIFNTELKEYLKQFGKSYQKYIPKEIKEFNKDNIRIFLDAFCLGDGSIKKKTNFLGKKVFVYNKYFTSSKILADDLVECIIKTGMGCSTKKYNSKGREVKFKNGTYKLNHDIYHVYELKNNYASLRSCKKEILPYNDIVYDIEVAKNNTLLIRYNNKIHWNSNCRCTYIAVVLLGED